MLDFGLLPPEINSGRMYSGPGPGPMLAAAEAWDGLAADLGFASAGYGATLAELTSSNWIGPTSLAMMAAVTPYVTWLSSTAAQAEDTANQARAAVSAYEAAFAMTVPPPAVAANRALLMALIATNFFGQNTPAIMATEALYVEMWAQDAAAMYGYAGASAVAAQVTPFAAPPQTAADDGTSNQASAVAQAAAAPAGQAATVAQNAVAAAPTTTTQTTTATTALPAATTSGTGATGGATVPPTTFFPWLEQLIYNTYSNYPSGGWLGLGLTNANITTVLKQTFQAYFAVGMGKFGASIGQQTTFGLGTTAGSGGAWYPTPQFAGLAPWQRRHARYRPVSARRARSAGSRCHRVGREPRPRRWRTPSLRAPSAPSRHRVRTRCSTVCRWPTPPVAGVEPATWSSTGSDTR